MDWSFYVYVSSNTSTQYVLALELYDTSAFRVLLFSLVLVGSEGIGKIEVYYSSTIKLK